MVSKVGRAKVLSKLDLTKGFHHIKVKEEDRDKLTFSCPFRKWRYKRMPFGMASAPATFQRLMDVVLEGCSHMSYVYIDGSDSWEDHLKDLDDVFRCLSQAGLTCKPSKCQFGMEKLVFLGHTIGGGEISVPKARVKAMEEFPRTRTIKQLRSFLGTANFYRKFVNGISKWQGILTPATSRGAAVAVEWTAPREEAFVSLSKCLSDYVCLCIPTPQDSYVLETDASKNGIGAVLLVKRDGGLRPVAYYSKQLQGAQRRYAAQELEGLALYMAVKHFSFYLYGNEFEVTTDHSGLRRMMTEPQENNRVLRWALKLANYRFSVTYRPGKQNTIADCLSRAYSEDDIDNEGLPSVSASCMNTVSTHMSVDGVSGSRSICGSLRSKMAEGLSEERG